ncbi:MAG: T9SS type A sorting domain-containing protein [Bacteroidia bacterium]
MKKIFTKFTVLLMVVMITSGINAQIPYTFSKSSTTYSPITGGTNAFPFVWDDHNEYVPLGFNFSYLGTTYTNVLIHSNGALFFDVDLTGPLSNYIPVIMIFGDYGLGGLGADLTDRGSLNSASPVVYKTEGTAPNRVFRVEWQNAGFFPDASDASFVNVQGKLYEGTNKIEIIIGLNAVAPAHYEIGSTGPVIGLGIYDMTDINNLQYGPTYFLSGPANSPTAVNTYSDMNGTPANGTVYNFTSLGTSLSELKDFNISVYPNPVTDKLIIDLSSDATFNEVQLIDITGRIIMSQIVNNNNDQISINVKDLSSGIYTVLLQGKDATAATKIIK